MLPFRALRKMADSLPVRMRGMKWKREADEPNGTASFYLMLCCSQTTTEAQMAQAQEPNIDAILHAEQERLNKRKGELEDELSQLDLRLQRIHAYFGTSPGSSQITRSPQGDRHPRGFVQAAVLKTVTEHPQGMTAAEIIKELGPQAIGQQSIANALGALTLPRKSPCKDGAVNIFLPIPRCRPHRISRVREPFFTLLSGLFPVVAPIR